MVKLKNIIHYHCGFPIYKRMRTGKNVFREELAIESTLNGIHPPSKS